MILSGFRYQDPWAQAEEAFTLPKQLTKIAPALRHNYQKTDD